MLTLTRATILDVDHFELITRAILNKIKYPIINKIIYVRTLYICQRPVAFTLVGYLIMYVRMRMTFFFSIFDIFRLNLTSSTLKLFVFTYLSTQWPSQVVTSPHNFHTKSTQQSSQVHTRRQYPHKRPHKCLLIK